MTPSLSIIMSPFRLRNFIFVLHRTIGLAIGLLLIIVGLTGSLLVFHHEIDRWIVSRQFGTVIPQEQLLPIDRVVEITRAAYPNWKIEEITFPNDDLHPLKLGFAESDANSEKYYSDETHEVFVNPYTGQVMGERVYLFTYYRFLLNLHSDLFLGASGKAFVGVVALLLLILSITGVILWPGWRKLIAGFKIKWNAHPKRVNFDIHKVAGIVTAVFLSLTAFTGFCFNFWDYSVLAIRAITFSPASEPVVASQPQSGQVMATINAILEQAQKALPDLKVEQIYFPYKTDPFAIYGKSGETIYVDPFTTQVLKVEGTQNGALGDRIINLFAPLHFGTFGGLPTRILYLLVGLSPLILFATGFVMWRCRKQSPKQGMG